MSTELERDDLIYLAGCSLAKTPGKKDNWIEAVGGELPEYICVVARAIGRGGRSTSNAIEIAVGRIKKWAAGIGGVTAATQGKAAAAVAQWEALKARAGGGGGRARLSDVSSSLEDALLLSGAGVSFSLDAAKEAFEAIIDDWMKKNPDASMHEEAPVEVKEVWTDFLLVEMEGSPDRLFVVPFSPDGPGDFDFGYPIEVRKSFVPIEVDGADMPDEELEALIAEIEAEDAQEQNATTMQERTDAFKKTYGDGSKMVAASQEVLEDVEMSETASAPEIVESGEEEVASAEEVAKEQAPDDSAEDGVEAPAESSADEEAVAQSDDEPASDADSAPELVEAASVPEPVVVPLLAEQSDMRQVIEEPSEETLAEVQRYLDLR